MITTEETYSLPQDDTPDGQRAREAQLGATRAEYEFDPEPAGPPGIKKMPRAEELTYQQIFTMVWDLADSAADLGLSQVDKVVKKDHEGKLAAYDDLYPIREKPTVSRRWRDDAEFGRQRLVATNPLAVRRCRRRDEIPDTFALDDTLVARIVGDGTTLDRLLGEERLYAVDYAVYQGIPPKAGHVLSDPYCLLYRDADHCLLPLALQLQQQPTPGPVFTRLDASGLWLLAKMWFQNADGMYSELASHLLRTHLVSETFWIGAKRQLASRHPLLELLAPHFKSTIAINHHARTQLLAHKGPVETCFSTGYDGTYALIRRAWAQWRFDLCTPSTDFSERGVDDPLALPGYFYRDDARKVWKVIRSFVESVVRMWYRQDGDVQQDGELQAWMRELTAAGYRGLPLDAAGRLNTAADLVSMLSLAIFTASAEHASINNGQYDYFGYLPNCAGQLARDKKPPGSHDQDFTDDEIGAYLPGPAAGATQISIAHMLSKKPTKLLGRYDDKFFRGRPAVRRQVALFQSDLAAISSHIQRRNRVMEVPYPYLDPERIGASVEI